MKQFDAAMYPDKLPAGLRKIEDCTYPCLSREHIPPTHIDLKPGKYEYTCPACGERTVFTVPVVTC